MEFNCTEKYTFVRGFNFHGDWGANGIDLWLENFDAARYKELIKRGKQLFPGINTLRIWLSFNAWIKNPFLYLKNVKKAGEIISEEGLEFIPVYFNGCLGVPDYDSFTSETLYGQKVYTKYKYFKKYTHETAKVFNGSNVLMHDISNEPYNNVGFERFRVDIVSGFLEEMTSEVRSVDKRPVTVGSQGGRNWQGKDEITGAGKWYDIDILNKFADVITLHPYCIPPKKPEDHLKNLCEITGYINKLKKPVIVTECCWFADTDEERVEIIKVELDVLKKINIGFLAHAMCESPVFDLHPVTDAEDNSGVGTAYMAFIQKNGKIRPGHDIINYYF